MNCKLRVLCLQSLVGLATEKKKHWPLKQYKMLHLMDVVQHMSVYFPAVESVMYWTASVAESCNRTFDRRR